MKKIGAILLLATGAISPSVAEQCVGVSGGEKSVLLRKGPAPQRHRGTAPPRGTTLVYYKSGSLRLGAWVGFPAKTAKKYPVVVYVHGGFALGHGDFKDALPFQKAGFAVMTPMLRGENGMPGNFELFGAEVDDVIAAVDWLRKHPQIDPDRVYVFGHSTGGGLAALVSLRCDAKVSLSGAGGLYNANTFQAWKADVPFDLKDQSEVARRLVFGHLGRVVHRHVAYIGTGDGFRRKRSAFVNEVTDLRVKSKLQIEAVSGNHWG